MGHLLDIRKLASRKIIDRASQLSMEWVVLERASIDEGTAILQNDHAIAKHVPIDRLGSNVSACRIENSGLQVGVGRKISGTRDDQHLAVVEQRGVHGIDGHGIWECLPLTQRACLSGGGRDVK
jgi:hypothetical protein